MNRARSAKMLVLYLFIMENILEIWAAAANNKTENNKGFLLTIIYPLTLVIMIVFPVIYEHVRRPQTWKHSYTGGFPTDRSGNTDERGLPAGGQRRRV